MSILEIIDTDFLRDTLKQSMLKMIRAANTLDRLLAQVTLMDETAKALRTRMWGGYLDYVSYISSTSSIAGIYSEGGMDRYIIIKHILQPLLSDARFLRAGIAAIKSQTDKLTFDDFNRLAIQNPPNLDVALSTRASESTLSSIKSKTDNIDVLLSTRASESTLSAIRAQTDRLTFDASNRLAIQNPPNLDRSLLMVKRELVSFAPVTGQNANLPVDDYAHWIDPSEYSVTETTWTTKTRVVIRPRNMPRRTYIIHMTVMAKAGTNQTIYIRFRSHYRGVLLSSSTSSTTYVWLEGNAAYVAPGWHDDPIYVEAYVTGGTGYISSPTINLVSANVVEGWTYSIDGEQFRPIMVDSNGCIIIHNPNLDVALSTRASESTLSGIKAQTDKLTFDASNRLAIQNPPNLDIALSSVRDLISDFGKIVLLSSTTTPLDANASWASAVDSDVLTGRIIGSVFADQAGTLYIEQSPDGTNWDVVDPISISANTGIGFTVEKVCPYTRVRYVNGATPQTIFRLYVFKRVRMI